MQVQAGKPPGAAWTWWEGKPRLSCKNMPQFAQTRHLRAPEWVEDVPQPLGVHLSSHGWALPCLHTVVSWRTWVRIHLTWCECTDLKIPFRNHTALPPTGDHLRQSLCSVILYVHFVCLCQWELGVLSRTGIQGAQAGAPTEQCQQCGKQTTPP